MRIFITGVAGFIGSHLAQYHLSAGDDVIGIDDFSSSKSDSVHLCNLKKNEKFTFINNSITSNLYLISKLLNYRIDIIYNFACPASPPKYQSMPHHTLDTCYIGLRNVLGLAHFHNSVVIHASTSEVYGDPACSIQTESYYGNVNSYGPRSCYDEGKRVAETLCYESQKVDGVDVRVIRIFNTYGPNMDLEDGRVITNFIQQAKFNKDITIYGNGNQTRSFCYIDDLISGITALASMKKDSTLNAPINLGNPQEFTVNQLARKIIKLTNSDSKIVYQDIPIDDPTQRCPDISRAYKLLGWRPNISLENGLKMFIKHVEDGEVKQLCENLFGHTPSL